MQGWHTTFLGMRGLPRDISDFEMKAFFTFDGAERDAINARRGDSHKLGLALHTFVQQLAKLPENTRVYPGHDYIENNLRFTLAREPGNAAAQALLPRVTGHDPATSVVTTLAEEKRFNTFFRLASPEVIAKLRESFPELPEQPDAKTVFTKLRELRNQW